MIATGNSIFTFILACIICGCTIYADEQADTSTASQKNIDVHIITLIDEYFNDSEISKTNRKNSKTFLIKTLKKLSDFSDTKKFVLHEREDLAKHFIVGINMGLTLNDSIARNIAQYKEFSDSRKGGSGFDFNDFAATLYGISLGQMCSNLSEQESNKMLKLMKSGKIKITSFYPENSYPHLEPEKQPEQSTLARFIAEINASADKITSQTRSLLEK